MVTAPAGALLRRMPVVVRDVVGQRRRPGVTVAAAFTGLAGVALMIVAPSAGVLAVGALALYAAGGGWTRGLASFLR